MNGYVAPGFEEVREVFAENFERRGELGASCAVVRDGESVVDIWGGHTNRERTQPWEADTLVLVYSLSKGISGLAAAIAHSRGCLDFDAAVTEVWPEFAAAGKQDVTIRQLLSEQAGLAAIETRLDPDAMRDPIALAAVLAAQTPEWTPGAWAGNHALTIGWIVSELIRRTDPAGRTLGRFVADEIATPLGAEFHFGLPEGFDQSRIARDRRLEPTEDAAPSPHAAMADGVRDDVAVVARPPDAQQSIDVASWSGRPRRPGVLGSGERRRRWAVERSGDCDDLR